MFLFSQQRLFGSKGIVSLFYKETWLRSFRFCGVEKNSYIVLFIAPFSWGKTYYIFLLVPNALGVSFWERYTKARHLKNIHFVNEFRVGTVIRLAIAISQFFSEARDSIQGRYLLINTGELLASVDDLDALSVRFIFNMGFSLAPEKCHPNWNMWTRHLAKFPRASKGS